MNISLVAPIPVISTFKFSILLVRFCNFLCEVVSRNIAEILSYLRSVHIAVPDIPHIPVPKQVNFCALSLSVVNNVNVAAITSIRQEIKYHFLE